MKTEEKSDPVIITPSPGDTSLPEPVRMSNGIPVYLIGNTTVELLRVEFVINAGQVTEEKHLAASFANAMLTEGTEMHDAVTINDLIDSTGAVFHLSADKDSASIIIVTLIRKLEDVIALAREVLFHPSFPEREFRLMTEKRLQAFYTGRQKTSVIARERFYNALCGRNNPYGRITEADDYLSLSTEDIKNFHSRYYRPDNMYITVAGCNPDQAMPLLEKYFSENSLYKWHPAEIPELHFETAVPGPFFAEVDNSVQSTVRMGWKGITHDHPDYPSLQVATMILGGYFGSRLMRRIREEKGYTYGIQAVSGAFHGIGYITLMTDVANNYRSDTLREIKNVIRELQEKEVEESEMTMVRNHFMGEIARMFDGPFSVADTLKGIIDYNAGTDYFLRLAETVRTVTPYKIRELYNCYFSIDNAYEIIAGTK